MTDNFASLARNHGLEDRMSLSPGGLTERYLYSRDMVFRYAFGRWWGATDIGTTAVWVLLNPATGDTEQRRRPTLERCIDRTWSAGHTGLVIVNLFAFRDTNPRNLRTATDAVGPANDDVLRVLTSAGAQTIAAWGGAGRIHGRSAQVGPLLDAPLCLGTTQRGEPRHPLYVPEHAPLVPWAPPTPPLSHEEGDSGSTHSATPPHHPAPAVQETVGSLFEREPVQFSLRGDAHLWRELRAKFAATPLPPDWYELRSLLEDAIDETIGVHPASRESAGWHDPDSEIYVPAFDPGHGMSAGRVHLLWWSHTAIPMLLDRYRAHRAEGNR